MARPLLSSDGTVVVPPMEAVWLSGAEWELHGGRGCLSFEVKGARRGQRLVLAGRQPLGACHERLAWRRAAALVNGSRGMESLLFAQTLPLVPPCHASQPPLSINQTHQHTHLHAFHPLTRRRR